jgi:ADP-ribose pyrophosphatase YjhB (NUDIX family)
MAEAAHPEETPETYDPSRYERPSVTVDVVIFTLLEKELHILLVKRRRWPYEGSWAIPGGFIDMDESLEQAARRELEEETGVRDIYLEQLYTFGEPKRDPRMRVISVAYFAIIRAERQTLRSSDESIDVRWYPVRFQGSSPSTTTMCLQRRSTGYAPSWNIPRLPSSSCPKSSRSLSSNISMSRSLARSSIRATSTAKSKMPIFLRTRVCAVKGVAARPRSIASGAIVARSSLCSAGARRA